MQKFTTTLLREKFVIEDMAPLEDKVPVIALSNRMVVDMKSKNGMQHETFVIRAQNMHSCVRMAARLVQNFQERGPLANRMDEHHWKDLWYKISEYERKHNPNIWIAIYHHGKVIYAAGSAQHHAFLDVIEMCDTRSKQDYEATVKMAEEAFRQAGRSVTIKHESNIALIVDITPPEIGKCGVILRGPDRTTTFNFTAEQKGDKPVRIEQCLSVAAAFLEGVQLCFFVGMGRQKKRFDLVEPGSEESLAIDAGARRIGRLRQAGESFERMLNVKFRPDQPNFSKLIDEAEDFAKTIFANQIRQKIADGDQDSNDWVE